MPEAHGPPRPSGPPLGIDHLAGWEVIKTPFGRAGISAGKLRQDRIYDEARETADPVRLMRVFGICSATATRYVAAAHPDKKVDPIRARRLQALTTPRS